MNKNLFLKLGLLVLALSLVACGQKNNLTGEDNSPKLSASNFISDDKNSEKENVKITPPSVENSVESKQVDEDIEKDTQQDMQQEEPEKEYYNLIKEAWNKQRDYIDSIDDPKLKQSVQTAHSAAVMESTRLLIEHPEDSEAINSALNRVINGE